MEVAASGWGQIEFVFNLVATTEVAGDGPGPMSSQEPSFVERRTSSSRYDYLLPAISPQLRYLALLLC